MSRHQGPAVALALIAKRSGERVKINRRDAVTLARLHRAGELTGVSMPDATHEAVRDLVRLVTEARYFELSRSGTIPCPDVGVCHTIARQK
jgi:hypothetical protein